MSTFRFILAAALATSLCSCASQPQHPSTAAPPAATKVMPTPAPATSLATAPMPAPVAKAKLVPQPPTTAKASPPVAATQPTPPPTRVITSTVMKPAKPKPTPIVAQTSDTSSAPTAPTRSVAKKRTAKVAAHRATPHKPSSMKAEIHGRITLAAGPGQQLIPGQLSNTLVFFVPRHAPHRPTPGRYTIYTQHHQFNPSAIAVPEGSTVVFANLDQVRHNVFSVTPGSTFDLGYQGAGEKISHQFNHPGLVLLACHVHHAMHAAVMVVPTRFSTQVAADGSFTLSDLPPGPGTLHFWNPSAAPASQPLTLPTDAAVQQHLTAVRPAVITDLNASNSP